MNRRNFLKFSGGIGSLALLQARARAAEAHYPFGIQLYTLRDDMPGDPDGVLRQLAGFGYKQIESFEGPMGMFWGKTPSAFRSYINDLGMDLVASHCSIEEGFEQKAVDAAVAGMQYLICPVIWQQPTMDDYLRFADRFNECGEICRMNGLKFAYHNHNYSFTAVDGVFPQDLLMQNTDPLLVDFELDMFWVVAAGQDVETWLRKYPGRFPLSHVKDRIAESPGMSMTATTTLGKGIIDYPKILPVAYELGMRYFFVEQESYAGTTPLESSADNAKYMQQFRF
jgi:sugar phosphate isomerase/epimerase